MAVCVVVLSTMTRQQRVLRQDRATAVAPLYVVMGVTPLYDATGVALLPDVMGVSPLPDVCCEVPLRPDVMGVSPLPDVCCVASRYGVRWVVLHHTDVLGAAL